MKITPAKAFAISLALCMLVIVACESTRDGAWIGAQANAVRSDGDNFDPTHTGLGGPAVPMPAAPRKQADAVARQAASIPGSLPSADEEVWVIVRPRTVANAKPREDVPGSGAMVTTMPGETTHVPIPLKHTNVDASIAGYIATVDVTQKFHNPYDAKIEAVYVFPLPQNAAVNGFVMQIGDRKIRGIIRDRAEAEKIYNDARAAGHNAALMTQQRPNIFTQKVANIEPGKAIDVHIRYFHTLAYDDGWYEFVFPMVVGPRFNPPSAPQSSRVSYLKPHERTGHDIALNLSVHPGVKLRDFASINHRIDTTTGDDGRFKVALAKDDRLPNKDFVFRYKVAGDRPTAAMLTHRGSGANAPTYFTLMLYPPAELDRLERHPVEMVFVLDCSGSMSGRPMEQSKRAMLAALDKMQPRDTFQIIRFSSSASQLGSAPIAATPENIRDAKKYVRGLSGGGGTMMIEGIKAALDFEHDPERLRYVVFLTDGYIGNESEILGAMKKRIGNSRVFSFGVGSSPNRYLMNRMAKLGRGAVAYLPLETDGDDVMNAFFDRISHPAMADIRIDWGGLNVESVYPDGPLDLFVGRPVIVTGKIADAPNGPSTIRMHGVAGSRAIEVGMRIDLSRKEAQHPAIRSVWARQKIASIMDAATYDPIPDLAARIKEVALEHDLMSAYTAFVAVDATRKTAGDSPATVPVPVPVPDGVSYDTTVDE